MEDDAEDEMNMESIAKDYAPLLWTRKLTARLLSEFKNLCPKVGESLKSLNVLHNVIARKLRSEFNCEITGKQVANKLKSIKRKYTQCKGSGRAVLEFGPAVEECVKLMDSTHAVKAVRTRSININEALSGTTSSGVNPAYSVEIITDADGMTSDADMLDISHFIQKTEKGMPKTVGGHDPLDGDVVDFGEKARRSDETKLSLLEKKIENQEKTLEERLKKNELIQERNRLIATLLTKKTKNDVIDMIRKDRLLHHREMRDMWTERLELEKKKLAERQRKNSLLEERNNLMKALLEQMSKKTSDNIFINENDAPPSSHTIELE